MDTQVRYVENPMRSPEALVAPDSAPISFHRSLPGYRPTPLRRAPAVAARWGVGEVWLKDESERFGLPSFKIVGALWAVHRLLCERVELDPSTTTVEQLTARLSGRDLGLVTASAGNWGRAVANVARRLSLRARILLPDATVPSRITAIESEQARVEVTPGNFDNAVQLAASRASSQDLLVADASSAATDRVPGWVSESYETIFTEVDEALRDQGVRGLDLVVVPIGAGALAAAAARHYRAPAPRLLGVEPHSAASMMESVRAGALVTLPAVDPTPMVGLNCGTPSAAAWRDVSLGFDGFCSISDAAAEAGMRTLARLGIDGGACSGAGLGALDELLCGLDPHRRRAFGLGPRSSILLLLTEGVTDRGHHLRTVGRGPGQAD